MLVTLMLEYRDYMKEEEGRRSFFRGWTTATHFLFLANLAIFVLFVAAVYLVLPYVVRVETTPDRMTRAAFEHLGLVPTHALGDLWLWQLVTYSFLHSVQGPLHLVFNLYCLYSIGKEVESLYGPRRFLALYFVSTLVGALAYCTFVYSEAPLIGASAAIYGIMVVFALHFPTQKIILIIVPVEAWLAVTIMIGLDVTMHLTGSSGGVGHLAHLGGAAAGYAFFKLHGRVEDVLDGFEKRAARAERQSAEAIEARLDTLLEKISKDGMESLSKTEREFLKRASNHYQKRA